MEPGHISERIESILRRWDAIDDHRTGTAGDRQTAQWLADEIRTSGVGVHLDGFPFRRRTVAEAWLRADDKLIHGLPAFDGGETGSPIEATLSRAGEAGRGGTIGVGTFSAAALDEETRALQAARARDQHTALLAVASGHDVRPGLAVINAEAYTRPFATPVLQVATEQGGWLESAAREGRTARLQIRFVTEDTEAFNVQAEIPGRRPELAPLVVMTPRSSWWVSTSERGGGIAIWLEAVRHFSAATPLRPVIFTANTGHELGHLGLDAWLARRGQLLRGAHAWVHLGANFAARGSALRFQASSDDLLEAGLAALAADGVTPEHVTAVGVRPLGEARNVFDGGGRYVSLLGTNPLFHHPEDRWPEAIDLPRSVALTQALLGLMNKLANEP